MIVKYYIHASILLLFFFYYYVIQQCEYIYVIYESVYTSKHASILYVRVSVHEFLYVYVDVCEVCIPIPNLDSRAC